jgi:hypothetical protein
MSYRDYAVAWNDVAEGYKDLFGRNEDPDDYTKRIVSALYGKGKTEYTKGVQDCVKWFEVNRVIPPRLSYKDPDFECHSVNGVVSVLDMKKQMTVIN